MKVNIQTKEGFRGLGRFLSKLVLPNIGAFIAWGLITAFFNPNGWWPNDHLSQMIEPMVTYMLPMLIGYTGGQLVGGKRGGVVGTIATMGLVAGSEIPMIMGAMLIGPLCGLITKKMDHIISKRIPLGFEMLSSNFSSGILGFGLAIVGFLLIGPLVTHMTKLLSQGVAYLIQNHVLFLVSTLIEPAKIMFLNNAINHGFLSGLGVQQAAETGKSIMFFLETNPGPGLGVLVATYVHAKGMLKRSAPSAMIIHLFGGIHELYFPYVLANPLLLVAVIAGGMSGVWLMSILEAGLVAMPSPGSIFAVLALSPKEDVLIVLLSVGLSTLVTYVIADLLWRFVIKRKWEATKESQGTPESDRDENHGQKTSMPFEVLLDKDIQKIVFACDTGMGSSAMGAAMVERYLKDLSLDIEVLNAPIDDLPPDAQVVITINSLTKRAKNALPDATHIGIADFLDRSQYAGLIEAVNKTKGSKGGQKTMHTPQEILTRENIRLNCQTVSKEEAIKEAGAMLVASGYVEAAYVEGMLAREAKFTTYIGNGVAIPHGENQVKDKILASGIVVMQYPKGVDFGGGNRVKLVIGIAGKGNEHIQLLSNIADAIEDEVLLEKMNQTDDPDFILEVLSPKGMVQ